MTENSRLQIASAAQARLTPQQKRFNRLVGQIERERALLAQWQAEIPRYREARHALLDVLQKEAAGACREFAFALEDVLREPGHTPAERRLLRDILCESAAELLDAGCDDDAVRELFDRHSQTDYATERQQERTRMKELTEVLSGLDLGDDVQSDEELLERIEAGIAGRAAQHAASRRRQPNARQRAAQARREADEQRMAQSVRDVYRKLVSALHPDREADPAMREKKTALMQKINLAYEASDLLTLLEAQLQIEQLSAGQLAGLDSERLANFVRVLEQQATQLRAELHAVKTQFSLEFFLDPYIDPKPAELGRLLREQERELHRVLARIRTDIRRLADPAAVRDWLRRERRERQLAPHPLW